MRAEEKEEELAHIKSFLSVYKPDLIENMEENEKPDSATYINDKKIGIEHTRLMQPNTIEGLRIKREEVMRDRVLSESQKIFKSISDEDIHVNISFDDFYWINYPKIEWGSQEYHKLPKAIAEFVNNNLPGESERVQITRPEDGLIEKYIWYLTISRFEKASEVNWSRPKGGIVPHIEQDIVQEILSTKNKKIKDYDDSCDEFWLLMIKNDFDYSMSVEVTENLISYSYDSAYSKLFIFDIATLELIELQVT